MQALADLLENSIPEVAFQVFDFLKELVRIPGGANLVSQFSVPLCSALLSNRAVIDRLMTFLVTRIVRNPTSDMEWMVWEGASFLSRIWGNRAEHVAVAVVESWTEDR